MTPLEHVCMALKSYEGNSPELVSCATHIQQLFCQSSSKPHRESAKLTSLSAVAKLRKLQNQTWNQITCGMSICIDFAQIRHHPFCLSTLDLGRDALVTGKQVVEIKHTLKEPRSLADPVRTTGHTRELHLRDICWSQANGEFRNLSLCICVYQLYFEDSATFRI